MPTVAKPVQQSKNLLASYRRHLNAEGKAAQSRENYIASPRLFLKFAEEEGMPALANLRREHIEMWLEGLREKYAAATVWNRFITLRLFFAWLVEEGEIKSNPMAKMRQPTKPEVAKDVVSQEKMAETLDRLEKAKRWRDLALLSVLYDTGMRATELANTRADDVDIDAGTIFIPESKARRPRLVRLSSKTCRNLDRYLRKPRPEPEYLFNGQKGKMTRGGIYQAVRAIFEKAGVKGIIGAHDMRHTSASHAAHHMSETALMTLYGWKDPDMARHYARQVLVSVAFEEHRKGSPMERLPKK